MVNSARGLRANLAFLSFGLAAAMLGLMVWVPHPDLTWHDQQRLGQIAVSLLLFFGVVLLRPSGGVRANPVWFLPFAGVLVFGTFSAAFAMHPLWSAAEIALLTVSIGMSVSVFYLVREFEKGADLVLGAILRLILAGMVFQFYVSFVSAMAHAELYFHPWGLLNGFSNVRFAGQFMTLVVPLLGVGLLFSKGSGVRYPRWLDMFLMVSLVGMVFVAGTRGTIAAWLAVSVLFCCAKGGARKAGIRMLWAMGLGFLFAWLILLTAAWVTGQPVVYRFTGEQVLGWSAREVLWAQAWAKLIEFPWLGIGPMHFASLKDPITAHPHQALLQIASEWGLPAFFMAMLPVVVWLAKIIGEVRSSDDKGGADLRWALLFVVLSAIVHSMVDGVLVMPYPQLWLAIMLGWCSARCLPRCQEGGGLVPSWFLMLLVGAANALLLTLAIMSYPDLVGAPEYCSTGPRFWCDGRI